MFEFQIFIQSFYSSFHFFYLLIIVNILNSSLKFKERYISLHCLIVTHNSNVTIRTICKYNAKSYLTQEKSEKNCSRGKGYPAAKSQRRASLMPCFGGMAQRCSRKTSSLRLNPSYNGIQTKKTLQWLFIKRKQTTKIIKR